MTRVHLGVMEVVALIWTPQCWLLLNTREFKRAALLSHYPATRHVREHHEFSPLCLTHRISCTLSSHEWPGGLKLAAQPLPVPFVKHPAGPRRGVVSTRESGCGLSHQRKPTTKLCQCLKKPWVVWKGNSFRLNVGCRDMWRFALCSRRVLYLSSE